MMRCVRYYPLCLVVSLLLLTAGFPAWGAVPSTMSVQGVLQNDDGTLVPDGPHDLTFRLWDADKQQGKNSKEIGHKIDQHDAT